MGGLDAIVFTGGIGENAAEVRSKALESLKFMGVAVDESEEQVKGKGENNIKRKSKSDGGSDQRRAHDSDEDEVCGGGIA